MKLKWIAAVSALTAVFFCTQIPENAQAEAFRAEEIPELVDMIPNLVNMEVDSGREPDHLYAMSAVLLDGDSGRVLYEKEGDVPRANASTTKVLTCILALEKGRGRDLVDVSAKAAAQPDVQLGMRQGERYYLEDLLYSLMLKSHNDTAVAIAEHIGGSVEGFARMMNEKAGEIGCQDTHFVTPNGLDSEDSGGNHHTTAHDLALIMRYAIQNEDFLKITQTRDYTFSDETGKRTFSLHNANALLDMMDGVISGKTGYTGEAGYCYVCAREQDGKTFVVSLLGCGWPGHKTYKWSDTRALLSYGEENYEYRNAWKEPRVRKIPVKDGAAKDHTIGGQVYLRGILQIPTGEKEKMLLMKRGEQVECRVNLPERLEAPVKKGYKLGEVEFFLGNEKIAGYPVFAEKNIEKISYMWYVDKVFHDFFH